MVLFMDTFMKKLLYFPTEFQREYDKIGEMYSKLLAFYLEFASHIFNIIGYTSN